MQEETRYALEVSLSMAKARQDHAKKEYDDAARIVRGLEALLSPDAGPVNPADETRTDAVLRILREVAPRRLQTAEVLRRLKEEGRDEDMEGLNRTLNALRRDGRVWTPGRLKGWTLAEYAQTIGLPVLPGLGTSTRAEASTS